MSHEKQKRIMIIDDDASIVKMLAIIIESNQLGAVVGTLHSGEEAVEEILFSAPDIVLVDLLLPHTDGIQIVKKVYEKGFSGKCIMVSQVQDAHMVSLSYQSGTLFFVSKPINPQEVISILREVSRILDLEKSVLMIKSALMPFQESKPLPKSLHQHIDEAKIFLRDLFQQMGISNEGGIKDLEELILEIVKIRIKENDSDYQLQYFYEHISNGQPSRTIEQRIRRVIIKAFQNLAEIGYDDFYHPVFQEFGPLLFDFKQLKLEMRRIDNDTLPKGKINAKKFVDGIVMQIEKNILNY